jgi:hypothetical protein
VIDDCTDMDVIQVPCGTIKARTYELLIDWSALIARAAIRNRKEPLQSTDINGILDTIEQWRQIQAFRQLLYGISVRFFRCIGHRTSSTNVEIVC